MLCNVCVGALQNDSGVCEVPGRTYIERYHHRDAASLANAAVTGCYICTPFWSSLPESIQDKKPAGLFSGWSSFGTYPTPRGTGFNFTYLTIENVGLREPILELVIQLGFPSEGVSDVPLSATYRLQPMRQNNVHSVPFPAGRPWTLVEQWLDTCFHNHKLCNEIANAPKWYPTRLLYLGSAGQQIDSVRIIETANFLPKSPYVTLSHRWGKAHMITLTRFNLSSFRSGIPIPELPKTFQDAIFVTKGLGIAYLWIDSLCIMQDKDNRDDWNREADRMRQVYTHSFCNISASAAIDSTQGLFLPKDQRTCHPPLARVCVQGLANVPYLDLEVVNPDFWQHNVSECTINKRAWVLQERLLSPRVLHFGEHQIFWECRELDACELYPEGLPEFMDNEHTNFKALNPSVWSPGSDGKSTWYRIWKLIVEKYSRTQLTEPSDKLVALSGVAKFVSSAIPAHYAAGLWHENLVEQILWQVAHDECEGGGVRPQSYRAPSWSWASIDAPINFCWVWDSGQDWKQNSMMVARVENVVLLNVTANQEGALARGYLDLRGFLKPVRLEKDFLSKGGCEISCDMRLYGTSSRSDTGVVFCFQHFVLDTVLPVYRDWNEQGRFYCMPVSLENPSNPIVRFLLLNLVDERRGRFERIGIGLSGRTGREHYTFCDALNENEAKNFPCKYYDNGQQTIEII